MDLFSILSKRSFPKKKPSLNVKRKFGKSRRKNLLIVQRVIVRSLKTALDVNLNLKCKKLLL